MAPQQKEFKLPAKQIPGKGVKGHSAADGFAFCASTDGLAIISLFLFFGVLVSGIPIFALFQNEQKSHLAHSNLGRAACAMPRSGTARYRVGGKRLLVPACCSNNS